MNSDTLASLTVPDEHLETARKLGLRHPIEALLCAPDRYDDNREILTDFDLIDESAETIPVVCRMQVCAGSNGRPSVRGYARPGTPPPRGGYKDLQKLELHNPFGGFGRGEVRAYRLEIDVQDDYGQRGIHSVFGSTSSWRDVQAGQTLVLRGCADRKFGRKLRFRDAQPIPSRQIGFISPVYLGILGQLAGSAVDAMVRWAIEDDTRAALAFQAASEAIQADCGYLPEQDILMLCRDDSMSEDFAPTNLIELLLCLHAPNKSIAQGQSAITMAQKICALGLQCRAQRRNTRPACADAPIGGAEELLSNANRWIERINADLATKNRALTGNQVSVIQQIARRLADDRPLNGLLNGEVGSGKTIAYAVPAVAAHQAGARVSIMAPTLLLADQIADDISARFGDAVAVERVKTGGKIKNPQAILVSTTGLKSAAKKSGYHPDFLICDEQHKLDTASREEMVAPFTHVLEVSATPIPRSLALSLYDGMDLLSLTEQPVKKEIHSVLIDVNERRLANGAIRKALAEGQRCAVVFTLVDTDAGTPAATVDAESPPRSGSADTDTQARALGAAVESFRLFEEYFPGQVVLLHGQMKNDEKAAALETFRSGQRKLMVTTTIFETGIDVPEVRVMVIRDPQQLGLSQLHQLRGRLARSGGNGLCFLLTEDLDALSNDTYNRLDGFCKTLDGYSLAREDMLTRGAGDLDGLQQKGRATTTFKGVKMTTKDLLFDMNRPRLELQANWERSDSPSATVATTDSDEDTTKSAEPYSPSRDRRHQQISLFC